MRVVCHSFSNMFVTSSDDQRRILRERNGPGHASSKPNHQIRLTLPPLPLRRSALNIRMSHIPARPTQLIYSHGDNIRFTPFTPLIHSLFTPGIILLMKILWHDCCVYPIGFFRRFTREQAKEIPTSQSVILTGSLRGTRNLY